MDIAGMTFGRLSAIECVGRRRGDALWTCVCDCGTLREVTSYNLRKGLSKSCGCLARRQPIPRLTAGDITGQKFNALTVLGLSDVQRRRDILWRCLCDCGVEKLYTRRQLTSGRVVSCGHIRAIKTREALTTHGMSGSPTYKIWHGVKNRCTNPNEPAYPNYGGRGIVMCDRWVNSFENFLADMGERPTGLSIERKDNDGPYAPDNCVWATRIEQNRNSRHTKLTVEMVREMRAASATGETVVSLSKRFGVSNACVSAVLLNRTWVGV